MSDNAELALFRAGVSCATVLEHTGEWKLDAAESTRRALKYRRGKGEILIVNHNGRGWWDPMSRAKGDVFDLVQHLDPRLNFGQVRQVLRRLVGIAPNFPPAVRERKGRGASRPVGTRWAARPRLRTGWPAWNYLAGERRIPAKVLAAAAAQDGIREGSYGSAWFAHRRQGNVCHVEVRGPHWKGSLIGGHKSLFRFGGESPGLRRLVVTEAPIDALSVAGLEGCRSDTLYVATGGGMGPGTIQALRELMNRLAVHPDALAVSGADANKAGDRYATQHAQLAAQAGLRFERLRPPEGLDWNDVMKQGRDS